MIIKVWQFEHDILQTACENFTKFTISVRLGIQMNWLDFEVKRSKVKIMTRPTKYDKNHLFKNAPSGEAILVDCSPSKTIQFFYFALFCEN